MASKDILAQIKVGEPDDNFVDEKALATNQLNDNVPARHSIEWSDYVMGQFLETEVFKQKNEKGDITGLFPKVHGLRRVAQKLIGEIVESECHCVQAGQILQNGSVALTCFTYSVKFRKHDGS